MRWDPRTSSAVLLFGLAVAFSVMAPLSAGTGAASGSTTEPAAIHIPTASAVLVGSAQSNANPLVAGDSVALGVIVSGYPGPSCGAETLAWVLSSGTAVQTVNSLSFSSGASPNGTYNYAWTAQTGNWNFTVSMTSPGCSTASSGPFNLIVEGSPGAGIIGGIPGWIYAILQVTWSGVQTAVYQGIAQPINSVILAIGNDVAWLETPWGNYLASWGLFGPVAVVLGFGTTAAACYGILDLVGAAKAALGD